MVERSLSHHDHDHAGHDHADHDHEGHADHGHEGHDHAGHEGHDHADRKGNGHAGHDHHGHDHDHDLRTTPMRRLVAAFGMTAAFMFVEAGVGFWSNSLALIADAGHMLADAAALGLAIFAQRIAAQTRTRARTYGFRRAEVLAAFANGIALALTAVWICIEAVHRWQAPPPILGGALTITAIIGLVVNLVSAWLLGAGAHGHNVNTRGALAHVLTDALGSVGAILAGVLILAFGWYRADPVISAAIGVLVLYSGFRLVQETSRVLMEGSPIEIDLAHVEDTLRAVPGVADLHDLHVWSISDGFNVLTVHVVLEHGFGCADVVAAATRSLEARHGIDHVTIQPEPQRDDQLVTLGRGPRPSKHPAAPAARAR